MGKKKTETKETTKSVREMALEIANKRKREEEIERENARAEYVAQENKRGDLSSAVYQALNDLKSLPGVKVNGTEITIGGRLFEVKIEFCTSKFRPCDDWPEEEHSYYLVRWYDRYSGACYGGHCEVEDFKKGFAQHMSMYL
jgi:hypothetical protein